MATFGPATNFGVCNEPRGLAVGDFDSNGTADLAVACAGSNSVYILLGFGDGTFFAGNNFAVGTNPRSLAVGDFNNDLMQDLAVANQGSNNVSIVLGP